MSKPTPISAAIPIAQIALVEERLSVDKQIEETGAVRVRIEVEPYDAPLTVDQVSEQVRVEHKPVNRVVDQRREPWHDGDVMVVPVYAEVAVLERRLVLVEEIRLHRHASHSTTEGSVPLKRQRAVIERRQADGSWVPTEADK